MLFQVSECDVVDITVICTTNLLQLWSHTLIVIYHSASILDSNIIQVSDPPPPPPHLAPYPGQFYSPGLY